ncbi:MAG: MMPL family transporter [Myxococcota bacterium]|nr:MMPL family transporter [Myxococcota bacterium]
MLAVAALVTAGALAGLVDLRTGAVRLSVDPSAVHLLPATGPERDQYERARQLFGAEEPFVVALAADDVFRPDVLRRVATLSAELAALPEIHHVVSLATAPDVIASENGDIELRPILDAIPERPEELAALRARTLGNPLYRGTLVADDARTVALFAYPDRLSSRDLLASGVADRVEVAARAHAGAGVEVFVSGIPFATAKLSDLLLRELRTLLPLTVLVLCVVLAFAFRSVLGVVLPITSVSLALVWTLGVMAWTGRSLNLVTAILPPLVVTVGLAYAMHVVADFGARLAEIPRDRAGRMQLAGEVVGEIGVSVLLAGMTTLAGFLSLALSPIAAIRELALFAVLGVAFAVVSAITVTPALLAVLPGTPVRAPRGGDWLGRKAGSLADFAVRRRALIVSVAALAVAFGAWGARRIETATEFVGNLDRSTQMRADYEAINARLGGANLIQIAIDSPLEQAFLEPANLRVLTELTQWLGAQPEIGGAVSLADYVALVNHAMSDGDPAALRVPDTKRAVGQLLLFGASDETERLTDARYQTANVVVRASVGDSRGVAALVDCIETRLAALPEPLHATVTGNVVLFGKSLDDLAGGQWASLGAAFLMIYACLAALFTSLLVGSIALGIAADDTIHTMARFNTEARRLGDERRAIDAALRGVIRPITFTLVGLCLGFSVLGFSELRSQAEFGLLAAATLAVGWVVDMTLTPALCAGVRVVTLWDVLTLDLGADPAREIPLFAGMSRQQMRIFVLLASPRTLAAGELLFREGDPARHGYLVLEGRLETSVDRDGERIVLEPIERGDTTGEIGLFAMRRSADVRALAPTRLVRFDGEDLERLRLRSPRTAALLYRNLNRIQSERQLVTSVRVR